MKLIEDRHHSDSDMCQCVMVMNQKSGGKAKEKKSSLYTSTACMLSYMHAIVALISVCKTHVTPGAPFLATVCFWAQGVS